MEASTVYYTDFRCPVGTSLTEKLRRLCIAAGIKNIDMEGKFVAIKMHFGELGNLAYLRPNYAKVVADLCKEQGGMPFLTDCNTLYPGSRKNALEHLTCAQLNGFWPMTTGCQVLIADGQQAVARDILLDIVMNGVLVEAMALDEQLGVKTEFEHALLPPYSSSLSTARNASVGIWTVPSWRIFFLPSFCFSSSFFLRVMSPP